MRVFLLILAATVDCFAACVALGAGGIDLPFPAACTVGGTSAVVFTLSLFFSSLIRSFIPDAVFKAIGFGILFGMGLWSFFSGWLRRELCRRASRSRCFRFGFDDVRCVLQICVDETCADLDRSESLSVREAFLFTQSVSVDLFLTGFGAQEGLLSDVLAVVGVLLFSGFFGWVGNRLGRKIQKKIPGNLCWFTGTLFCALAVWKLF